MKIEAELQYGSTTLKGIEVGKCAWISLESGQKVEKYNCCLVMRTGCGYIALETGYVNLRPETLNYPAIPANVKIVED